MHEVTSPQAFDGLRAHNRPVRQPGKTFATMDYARRDQRHQRLP
ncbi:hypothetical protein ACNKHQ_00430 [Shigella flexneri]